MLITNNLQLFVINYQVSMIMHFWSEFFGLLF
jgi:hypothetical protein